MSNWVKSICLLVFLVFLYVTGALIFAKGFLLKRVVLDKNSSCHVDFAMQLDQHGEEGCWMHKRFRKAVIIIIDALRFDFIHYDPHLTRDIPPYRNKLPIIHKLMNKTPNKAKLYRFIADPPTTTLQRLKGLTTGSLPTFVDAGSNFASSEILEDNLIDQLVKHGRRIKFLGDDTWMTLFPERFSKSHSFPSFNVKDLHTVDNGILKHLMSELRGKDWDVLIAHFLGVDHCGHRYGPNHPAMSEKLIQMNNMISNVTRQMQDDTILFVFGDHGMTVTGDHGGDSGDELEAGLFVYSPVQLTTASTSQEIKTVLQTDFVPTLALLLGVPIPFSNLGHIITDFFNHCPWWNTDINEIKQVYHTIKALRLNAIQISHYLEAYVKLSSDFPHEKHQHLSHLLSHAENTLQKLLTDMVKDGETSRAADQLRTLMQQYTDYISEVQGLCRSIWAKFDLVFIALGILTIANALFLNLYLIMHLASSEKFEISRFIIPMLFMSLYTAYVIFQALLIESKSASFLSFLLGTVSVFTCIIQIIKEKQGIKWISSKGLISDHFIVVAVCGIYFSLYFSNSFVVYEDSISQFVTQSLIWIYCLKTVSNKVTTRIIDRESAFTNTKKQKRSHKVFDILQLLSQPAMLIIQVTVLLSMCIRLTSTSRACREEQANCSQSALLQPLASLDYTSSMNKNVRYFVSISCLGHSVFMLWRFFRHYGNLNDTSLAVLCARYGFPSAAVCCALHWCLQGLSNTVLDILPPWQQTIMARSVYIIIIVSLISIVFDPLCIYILPNEKDPITIPVGEGSDESVVSHVFKQLKERVKRQAVGDNTDNSVPVVFGLGTVMTSAVLYIGICSLLLLNLLLGDGLGPSMLLVLLCWACFLELHTVYVGNPTTSLSDKLGLAVTTTSSLCVMFFYGTGHQATVSSVRWESAFTGFHGDFQSNIIPAVLIHLNTFASEVVFTALMPLLVIWPFYGGILRKMLGNKKENRGAWRGDLELFDDKAKFQAWMTQLFAYVFIFKGIRLFGSVCAAASHRRHLMVWKIFAPRFVFEALSCLTVFSMSIMMFLFLMRLYRALEKWTQRLESS